MCPSPPKPALLLASDATARAFPDLLCCECILCDVYGWHQNLASLAVHARLRPEVAVQSPLRLGGRVHRLLGACVRRVSLGPLCPGEHVLGQIAHDDADVLRVWLVDARGILGHLRESFCHQPCVRPRRPRHPRSPLLSTRYKESDSMGTCCSAMHGWRVSLSGVPATCACLRRVPC